MSDKISIIESKCLWYDTGGGKDLCIVHSHTTESEDWWVIFYNPDPLGREIFSCNVRGFGTGGHAKGHTTKHFSQGFIERFPNLKKIQNQPFEDAEELLKAFGDIVNSENHTYEIGKS